MIHEDDPIDDLARRLESWASPAEVQRIVLELRAEFGGKAYYIKKARDAGRICADRDSTTLRQRK